MVEAELVVDVEEYAVAGAAGAGFVPVEVQGMARHEAVAVVLVVVVGPQLEGDPVVLEVLEVPEVQLAVAVECFPKPSPVATVAAGSLEVVEVDACFRLAGT